MPCSQKDKINYTEKIRGMPSNEIDAYLTKEGLKTPSGFPVKLCKADLGKMTKELQKHTTMILDARSQSKMGSFSRRELSSFA